MTATKPGKMTAAEKLALVRSTPSIDFDGHWDGTVYHLEYMPQDAGDFELHLWSCDSTAEGGGDGARAFLPGCPVDRLHEFANLSHERAWSGVRAWVTAGAVPFGWCGASMCWAITHHHPFPTTSCGKSALR